MIYTFRCGKFNKIERKKIIEMNELYTRTYMNFNVSAQNIFKNYCYPATIDFCVGGSTLNNSWAIAVKCQLEQSKVLLILMVSGTRNVFDFSHNAGVLKDMTQNQIFVIIVTFSEPFSDLVISD